ncbi:hypothetical protein NXF25_004816 [Crotalus adamanteus]|uniref:Uncharacterized protein n=1 Tax=Crotalus adamanteus TaxID=8729 RepID=A0AAW1BVL2_CROAD
MGDHLWRIHFSWICLFFS